MSTTGIEWTDTVWNPTTGCTRVSEGCRNCYAFQLHDQRHAAYKAGKKVPAQYAKPFKELQLFEDRLTDPLSWRKPRRVFVNSMSDLFHDDVPDAFLLQVFDVMRRCTWAGGQNCGRIGGEGHTFQVLTKRPARMLVFCSRLRWDGDRVFLGDAGGVPLLTSNRMIWLGVSVENQAAADERITLLLRTPAAVRFLSCEPLLGPVDVSRWLTGSTKIHMSLNVDGALRNKSFAGFTHDDGRPMSKREAEDELKLLRHKGVRLIPMGDCKGFSAETGCPGHRNPGIDWVIVGGESGPGARPFDLACARSLVGQCAAAGVACFVKQLGALVCSGWSDGEELGWKNVGHRPGGGFADWRLKDSKGGDPSEWPADLRVRDFPEAKS